MDNHRKEGWAKYVVVFLITVGIFVTIFYVSSTLTNKKVDQLTTIQDNISIDLLSSETQYQLLGDLDCSQINTSILSDQLRPFDEGPEAFQRRVMAETTLAELGADSLDRMTIMLDMESEFDLSPFADADAEAIQTVGDLVALVERQAEAVG